MRKDSYWTGRGTAGAILCMCLLAFGCTTVESGVTYDGAHPLIHFSKSGIRFKDEYVTAERAVELLEKNKIPHEATIHILVDDDFNDDLTTWVFQHNYLARAGYNHSLVVSKRVARSESFDKRKSRNAGR